MKVYHQKIGRDHNFYFPELLQLTVTHKTGTEDYTIKVDHETERLKKINLAFQNNQSALESAVESGDLGLIDSDKFDIIVQRILLGEKSRLNMYGRVLMKKAGYMFQDRDPNLLTEEYSDPAESDEEDDDGSILAFA